MKKNYLPHFSNQRFNIRHLLTALLFISTLIGLSIRMSSANNRLKVFICNSESPSHFFMPDSTFDSTINTENYSYGDTMEFYLDGPDTIYMLYVDTTTADSISSLERAFTSDDIVISLTDVVLPVQEGLFGFNTQDIFRLTHYDPADNVIYSALGLDNPKELMVSLAPKNLRYPSGSSSKFRHALGSWNSSDPNNPFHDQKNGGYGINIEEMIPYYDITNPFVPYPGFLIVYNDFIEDSEHDIDGNWLIDDVKASFEDFFGEWLEQPHYDPGMYLGIWEEPLYINEFIGMVKAIEDENPGFTVDVIYTLDILSEPAAECKLIIEYLRNESLNHQLDVNVVGVELGNECYNNFFEFTMGFKLYDDYTAFEHYWAYINGADDYNTFFGITGDFDLSAVLPPSMMGLDAYGMNKHNYIAAFKTDPEFDDIKIGLPAENPSYEPTEDKGPFIVEEDEDQAVFTGPPSYCHSWNECLYYRYSETIGGKFKFDAVIPHIYFTAENDGDSFENTNWGEIPIGLGPNCLDENLSLSGHQDFIIPTYNFLGSDPRLSCAFDGIVSASGYPYAGSGSFREFVATREKIGFMDLNSELHFDHPSNKECWPTEWNLKTNGGYPATDLDGGAKVLRRDVYANRFVHSYLLQEELLNFIKFNNNAAFRVGFMPYANVQNYLGGSSISLISRANKQDKVELGVGTCGDDLFDPYVARTTYYSLRLLNKIALEKLNYLKTTQAIYYLNINRPPTAFIADMPPLGLTRDVYIYYTNIKNVDQTYVIRPGSLAGAYLTGTHAEIHCVDGLQLYSGSGKGAVYDINDAYDDCNPSGYPNQFEIQGERPPYIDYSECPEPLPAGAMCVTVPAFSCGYFVFSYNPYLRLEQGDNMYEMYPNPANTSFSIKKVYAMQVEENQTLEVNIRNMTGAIINTVNVLQNQQIDISKLPVGVYLVEIKSEGHVTGTEQLVKMK